MRLSAHILLTGGDGEWYMCSEFSRVLELEWKH